MLSATKIALIVIVGLVSFENATANVNKNEFSLLKFMTQSRALTQDNPTRSLECFNYYIPLLNFNAEEYERTYTLCLRNAEENRKAIDANLSPKRDEIESTVENACNALQACNVNSNSIAYFECYVDEGAEQSKTMYSISADSSEILRDVREVYALIEFEEHRCTNASERAYVSSTTYVYEELDKCLKGEIPVPTTTTTAEPTTTPEETTTTPEETTTTEQPEETTTSGQTEGTTEESENSEDESNSDERFPEEDLSERLPEEDLNEKLPEEDLTERFSVAKRKFFSNWRRY